MEYRAHGGSIRGPPGGIQPDCSFFYTPTLAILRDTVNVESARAEGLENLYIFGFVKSTFMGIFVQSERAEGPENLCIFGSVKSTFMGIFLESESAESPDFFWHFWFR